ncbi:unnamed protein product [[Candida] boidinii]|nr:unnamed protein product [[Candida] boidinii]
MYWILRGTVGVTSTDGEAVYAELGAGSFFGEIGILFNRPRTATVVARTKVLLGVLTKDALSIVLSDFPIIERLIRDEGQERLAMQRKRKRPNRNMFQNNAFQRRDTRNMSDHYAISASEAALEADNMPGPALPPISAVLQTPFVTSNAEQLMSPIGSQSNNSNLGNITNNNDLNGIPI